MAITQIPSEFISTNAISGTIIADNAITAVHIATNAVSGTLIADNAVTAVHIATNAISGTLIADNALTAVHIAGNSITAALLEDNAVGTDQLAGIARGKIIYGDSSGDPQLLALGSNGQVLKSDGSDITWGSISTPITALNNASENYLVTVGATTTELESEGGLTWDTSTLTMSGNLLVTASSSNTERSIRVLNSTVTGYLGVEGSSNNRFVGSAANMMFLGTTGADGIEFATNNNVRAVLDSSGKLGIGIAVPTHSLHVYTTDAKGFLLDRASGSNAANLNEFSTHYSLSIKNRASGSYLNFAGAGPYSALQATDGAGSATAKNLILNPWGGTVGIGTGSNTPARLLTVEGSSIVARFGSSSVYHEFNSANGILNFVQSSSPSARFQVNGADFLTINGAGGIGMGAGSGDFAGGILISNDGGTGTLSAAYYNTGLGWEVFDDLTSGDSNTAIGNQAGYKLTSGSNNTAVGRTALENLTNGVDNVAIGYDALKATGAGTDGSYNVAVGVAALTANTQGQFNVAIGRRALYTNTTADENTAVGYLSLYLNETGANNTAVGNSALQNNVASANTAVGDRALTANTSGNSNVATGKDALYANQTGSNNVAIGYEALKSNESNHYNVAVGMNTLRLNTADDNVAVGYNAQAANTTGTSNTAIGHAALDANQTSANNTAVGTNALGLSTAASNTAVGSHAADGLTNGGNNTAMGYNAMGANASGGHNTAIGMSAMLTGHGSHHVCVGSAAGYTMGASASKDTLIGREAGFNCRNGVENVAVGYQALYSAANSDASNNVSIGVETMKNITTGTQNTALGKAAGNALTSGSYNTFLGAYTGKVSDTANYNICIGWEAGDSTVTTGSGNVLIGYNAQLGGNGQENSILIGSGNSTGKGSSTAFITGNGGSTYNGANSSSWATTSDRRIKKNIEDNSTGLDKINQIRVRNFEYRLPEEVDEELPSHAAIKKEGIQVGVIAQEIMEILPDTVKQEDTGCYSVDPDNLTWYLINAVQELSAEVEKLKNGNNNST